MKRPAYLADKAALEKCTFELVPGDRVLLPGGRIRTVKEVKDSGMVNFHKVPIHYVMYAEGATDGWSEGNSAALSSTWRLAE